MSEKLGFDQLVRNGRHVECDEGHARSQRMPMQRLGDKFLAGAGLAVDEDRDIRVREAADGAEDLLHRRRLPDDLGGHRRLFNGQGGALLLSVCNGALDDRDGVVHIEGFGEVLEGP